MAKIFSVKRVLICFFILSVNLVLSQVKIKEIPLKLYPKSSTFQIISEDQKEICIFFDEQSNNGDPNDDNVKAIRFNDNLDPIDSLYVPRPVSDRAQILVGYSKKDAVYYTYWKEQTEENIFTYQSYDFTKREVNQGTIAINSKGADILCTTTINNVFYVITLEKKTNIMNFYSISSNEKTKHSIDLSKNTFLDKEISEKEISITDLLSKYSLKEISDESPSSVVNSSYDLKLYNINAKELLFTLDHNHNYTQGFKVSLDTYAVQFFKIKKPVLQDNSKVNSNSFYFNNQIAQIKNNSDELILSFKKFNGDEIKSYRITETENPFNYSEIIQENGTYKSAKVIEKSEQFLRKINSLSSSISCYDKDGKIKITIGGVGDYINKTNTASPGLGAITGFMVAAYVSSVYNYALSNINSFENRKIVYLNSTLDKDFNTISEGKNETAFDKVRKFMEENDLLLHSIFKKKNELILGAYHKKTKKYCFYKFDN